MPGSGTHLVSLQEVTLSGKQMADDFIDNVIMLTNSFTHGQQINASNRATGNVQRLEIQLK